MAIKFCPCIPHKFQDSRYGQGMRVHVPSSKGWVCSVCGKTKESSVNLVSKRSGGKK